MPDQFGNPLVFLHRGQAFSAGSDKNVGGKTERMSDCRVSSFLTIVPLTIVETSRFNNMTKLENFLNYKAKIILGTLDIANKDLLI